MDTTPSGPRGEGVTLTSRAERGAEREGSPSHSQTIEHHMDCVYSFGLPRAVTPAIIPYFNFLDGYPCAWQDPCCCSTDLDWRTHILRTRKSNPLPLRSTPTGCGDAVLGSGHLHRFPYDQWATCSTRPTQQRQLGCNHLP